MEGVRTDLEQIRTDISDRCQALLSLIEKRTVNNQDPDSGLQGQALQILQGAISQDRSKVCLVATKDQTSLLSNLQGMPTLTSQFEFTQLLLDPTLLRAASRAKAISWMATLSAEDEDLLLPLRSSSEEHSVGRDTVSNLVTNVERYSIVSKPHVHISPSSALPNRWMLTDVSRNGTFLRAKRLDRGVATTITDGDTFVLAGEVPGPGCPTLSFRCIYPSDKLAEFNSITQASVLCLLDLSESNLDVLSAVLGRSYHWAVLYNGNLTEDLRARLAWCGYVAELNGAKGSKTAEMERDLVVQLASLMEAADAKDVERLARMYSFVHSWVSSHVERVCKEIQMEDHLKEHLKERNSKELSQIQEGLARLGDIPRFLAIARAEADRTREDLENRALSDSGLNVVRTLMEGACPVFLKDFSSKSQQLFFELDRPRHGHEEYQIDRTPLNETEADKRSTELHQAILGRVAIVVRERYDQLWNSLTGAASGDHAQPLILGEILLKIRDLSRTVTSDRLEGLRLDSPEYQQLGDRLARSYAAVEERAIQSMGRDSRMAMTFVGGLALQHMTRTVRSSLMTLAMLLLFLGSGQNSAGYMSVIRDLNASIENTLGIRHQLIWVLMLSLMLGYTIYSLRSEQRERCTKFIEQEREKLIAHYMLVAQAYVRSFDREFRNHLQELQAWMERETKLSVESMTQRMRELSGPSMNEGLGRATSSDRDQWERRRRQIGALALRKAPREQR